MRFDLGPPLAAVRAAELARLDMSAHAAREAVRPSSLAAMDAMRLDEARRVLSAERPRATPALDAMPGDQHSETKALIVVQAAEAQGVRLLAIEAARLTAKSRLRACNCTAAMRQIQLEISDE